MPTGSQAQAPAFEALVEAHRTELHAHCYRMLGSVHDADDALQETLLRTWRALPSFEGRSSYRTWLHRIATNVCLDAIAARPKRGLPIDRGIPAGEPEASELLPTSRWIEPYPDAALDVLDGGAGPESRFERREALELAFVAALQHLSPRQRAVLIARDVLGFAAAETAEILDTTATAVNGALLRARARVEQRLPERSQQACLRTLGDQRVRALGERFADSFERGDVEAILALLAEDATFQMPPFPDWRKGKEAIADSWLMPIDAGPRLRYTQARANGQLAFGAYRLDPGADVLMPIALDVLTLEPSGKISSVVAFRDIQNFERFGLPPTLTGTAASSAPAKTTPRSRAEILQTRGGFELPEWEEDRPLGKTQLASPHGLEIRPPETRGRSAQPAGGVQARFSLPA